MMSQQVGSRSCVGHDPSWQLGTPRNTLFARSSVGSPFFGRRVGMESTVMDSLCEWGATSNATTRGIRAWRVTWRLATRSGISGGRTLKGCRTLSEVGRSKEAFVRSQARFGAGLSLHLSNVSHREAMLNGLRSVDGGNAALPFVLQLNGNPSSHLWDHDNGTNEILQGEGGEQGDPLMPMLYSFHNTLLCALCNRDFGLKSVFLHFLMTFTLSAALNGFVASQPHSDPCWKEADLEFRRTRASWVDDILRIAQVADPRHPGVVRGSRFASR